MKLSRIACLAVTAPLAAQGQVLVVDAFSGPGTDHTQISAAVAAASPGDTILIRTGHYDGFTVDGMGLTLVADHNELALVSGTVTVRNLPADQSVVLHDITPETAGPGPAMLVENCAGPVWLEDSFLQSDSFPSASAAGLEVRSSAHVSVHRSSLLGSPAWAEVAGPGLRAVDSNVYLYETVARGGDGVFGLGGGLDAAAGAWITGGQLYAAGGFLIGGKGHDGLLLGGSCWDGGDGGGALILDGAAPSALLRDVERQVGAGGFGPGVCVDGAPGVEFVTPMGSLQLQSADGRRMWMHGPVREGQPVDLQVDGIPGDQVVLLIAPTQNPVFFQPAGAFLGGAFLPDLSNPWIVPLGTVGVAGSLTTSFAAPAVVGEVQTLFFQAGILSGAAEIVFSAAQSLTVLDSTL